MPRRRAAIIVLVALLAVSLTGCDHVRAGARCVAGSPAGRDATHVLVCQSGRWRRVMTIGQAAQFVVANLPGSVTSANGPTATATAGGAIVPAPKLYVMRRNGQPLGGAKVTLSGSGLAGSASGETGPDGVVNFVSGPLANGTVGTWTMTASVDGTDLSTSVAVATRAAEPAAVTILSGDGQTGPAGQSLPQPLVARATDRFGNPVPHRTMYVDFATSIIGRGQVTTGSDGIARFVVWPPPTVGLQHGRVSSGQDGSGVSAPFTQTVLVGAQSSVDVESGDGQSTTTNTPFPSPIRALVTDGYGNPKAGVVVVFDAVPNAGATAVLSSSTAVSDSNGIVEVTATAGVVAGTYAVTATVGSSTVSFVLSNV